MLVGTPLTLGQESWQSALVGCNLENMPLGDFGGSASWDEP